ncbi:hypothetical protein EV361DRAFT_980715 [Lentinula raphanica]|nr:hypothetical protein EV360DRAFT_69057 [Lentinula raphanica]KAJ3964118.1 hypothetical protein EV361DRAFT_980715 [Lentinula raphanica]
MMENSNAQSYCCDMRYPASRDLGFTALLDSNEIAKEWVQCLYNVLLVCHHHRFLLSLPSQAMNRDINCPEGKLKGRDSYGVDDGVRFNDFRDLVTTWAGLDLSLLGNGPRSHYRTGTRPYLAYEQHRIDWHLSGPHPKYRHDMESLFYVMVLFTFSHSEPSKEISKPVDEEFRYEEWHQFDDEALYYKKCGIMTKGSWKPPVQPFFLHFSNWLREVRVNFRRGFAKQADFVEAKETAEALGETWLPHETQFYEDYSLGGHISYSKMARIMHVFNKEELVTYDDGTVHWNN